MENNKTFSARTKGLLSSYNRQYDWYMELLSFVLMLIFFAPMVIVLINSAKTGFDINLDPLALPSDLSVFFDNVYSIVTNEKIRYFESFWYSTIITVTSLTTIGVFSGMAAWVLVRTKTKYSRVIFMLFLSGLVIPFQVVMIPLVELMVGITEGTGIPLKETWWGVVLAYNGFGAPLSVFMFYGFIKSIPTDIEEAAIIDGCSKAQVYFKVVLPILKPIFVTMLVLNGLWIWNDFLLPLLVLGADNQVQTLPLTVKYITGLYSKDWGLILSSVVLAAIPVIVLFLFAQKHIIKGMTSGAIK